MRKHIHLPLVMGAALLCGCADGHGSAGVGYAGGPYDVWYDGYYGPYYGGYWDRNGFYYYDRDHVYHHDDGNHFQRGSFSGGTSYRSTPAPAPSNNSGNNAGNVAPITGRLGDPNVNSRLGIPVP